MTYGVIVEMSAPLEMYDALHQELQRVVGNDVDGLLVHLARATADGFQVIEIWGSREQYDRYNREVVWPLAAQLWGGPPAVAPTEQEFEVHGLFIPGAQIFR